jgi:tetratricopeptide (TPR) repeat protein
MRRQILTAMWIAAVLVSIPVHLSAQGVTGRLVLTVQDTDGNPIQGVAVSATCAELPKFKQNALTNKRGKVTLAFADATKVYDLKIEYEGHMTMEIPFKPEIRKARSETVTLVPVSGVTVAGGGTVVEDERVYTAAESVFNDGVEALQEGDYQTAMEKFLKAQKMDPNLVMVHSGLGTVYLELGDPESAIAAANTLLEHEPDNPRGYRLLYEAHQALGNEQEAEKALKRLAQLDSGGDTATLVFNEGVEALKVGDRKAAKDRFREAVEVAPDFGPALSALAVLLINDENFEEAAATAEKLLTLQPDNIKAMRIAYQAYRSIRDTEREAKAFERLAAANPAVVATQFFDKGVDQFNLGQTAEAIENFEQALAVDDSLAKSHYYLGLCYTNTGNGVEAKKHFETFLRLAPGDQDAAVAEQMLEALGD